MGATEPTAAGRQHVRASWSRSSAGVYIALYDLGLQPAVAKRQRLRLAEQPAETVGEGSPSKNESTRTYLLVVRARRLEKASEKTLERPEREHPGVTCAPQGRSMGERVRRLDLVAQGSDAREMRGRIKDI